MFQGMLPAIRRQLIEYIDREGHGSFVLAVVYGGEKAWRSAW